MIDYHSHILPGVDDGSRNIEESLQLLKAEAEQGVGTVFATPHFYSDARTFDDFLSKRNEAFVQLKPYLTADLPEVRLGAEVTYFEGISRTEQLSDLCLEGTDLILIEMPNDVWSSRMVDELVRMNESGDLRVILAHVERYAKYQKKDLMRELINNRIIMQMTGDFITDKRTRRYALKLIKKGMIHILGSDCHNMTHRPPVMRDAHEIVLSELGDVLQDDIL